MTKTYVIDGTINKLNEVSELMELDLDYERVINQLIEDWSGGN